MTGICGLARGTKHHIETMLSQMDVRGSIKHATTQEDGGTAIGLCSSFPAQSIIKSNNSAIAFDGGFFNRKSLEETVIPALSGGLENLFACAGAFSFVALQDGMVIAGRDPLGQKPLYYGEDRKGRYAFASLVRGLKAVGVEDTQPVPPGQLITVSNDGVSTSSNGALRRPREATVDEDRATERLGALLLEAVSAMVPGSSALSFSGGLDSSLVAEAMKRKNMDPQLITVGVGQTAELDHASEIAEELGLSHTTRVLLESEVVHAVPLVAETVEATEPTIVSVALPFLFACQEAGEMKLDTIVAGQLSDELFGGYARFEQLALTGQFNEVEDEVWRSVLAASTNDFEPGDKTAVASGLELRCPFSYLPLVNYALTLPTSLKVRLFGTTVVRKYLLRMLAKRWGLPDSVVNRPKKAVQYSSGVHKVLMREAGRRRVTLTHLTSPRPT